MAKMTQAGMNKLRKLQDAKDAAMNAIYRHGVLDDLRFSDCCRLASEDELEAYQEASRKLLEFQFQMVREGRAYWEGGVGRFFIPNR